MPVQSASKESIQSSQKSQHRPAAQEEPAPAILRFLRAPTQSSGLQVYTLPTFSPPPQFHVHTVADMPEFHEMYVSKSSMPQEYGGNDKTCKDIHGMHIAPQLNVASVIWFKSVQLGNVFVVVSDGTMKRNESSLDYLRLLDTLLVDETKRAGKSKSASDVFGIQGSFKKLDLD